jgi:hypothetical protein
MNRRISYRLALLFGVVLAVATVGWAKSYHMTSTSIVPAAKGEINVDKEKDGNVQVHVEVEHLAKPGKLTPPANTYVVWLQEADSQPHSLGQLRVGDDLKGELKATTTLNNFTVFITAETDSQTRIPSNQVVLRATVQQ